MIKDIHLEKETREKMLEGVLILDKAVGSTLGPMGSNVVIETPYGATTVTKDGVTVAKHIDLDDPVQNLGVQILKQAASRTASLAGDGTTTATVLAASLVQSANKLITAGVKPIEIKRRLEALLIQALDKIRGQAKAVDLDKIGEIATISANNDEEIGDLIQKAYDHVGSEGLITLEESKTGATTLTVEDGVAVNKGFASPYFITDAAKGEAVLENPVIFITDAKVRYTQDIVPIMEKASALQRPLLIIADEVDSQALQLLVLNKMRGTIEVCAINAPSFGDNRMELMRDIAALTSATLITQKAGARLEDTPDKAFGSALRVIVSKNKTVFVSPKHNESLIQARAEEIKTQLQTEQDDYLRNRLQKRLADLTAKVAVLSVGGATETELKERKDRVDDALRATACAVQKGYLIGGGVALARISKGIEITDQLIDPIFARALTAPLRRIVENAGEASEVILARTLDATDMDTGFNARTLQYSNLLEDGVIDPALVVEQALCNAVSAATMIILSSTAVTNKDRKPPFSPGNMEDYAA
jgi:chaperonin GroEL